MGRRRPARGLAIAISIALVTGGVGVGGWTARGLQRGLSSVDWPRVEGTIVESRVRGVKRKKKRTVIRYAYVVDGLAFEGRRVGYFHGIFGPGTPRGEVERFPEGRRLPVYHAPGRAEDSVLEPGVWWVGGLASAGIGFALFGAGGYGLFGALHGRD